MRGLEVPSLILGLVGVGFFVWSVFLYSGREDNTYTKCVEEIQGVRGDQKNFMSREDFVAQQKNLMDVLQNELIEIKTRMTIKGNYLEEEITKLKKEQEFMSARLHGVDKRVGQVTKTVKVELSQPVPVDVVTKPPAPKAKGKKK